jgi:uncharacterized protein YukE
MGHYFSIEPDRLIESSKNLKAMADILNIQIELLDFEVTATLDFWEGAAKNVYISSYNEIKSDYLNKIVEIINSMVTQLDEIVDNIEEADDNIKSSIDNM